MKKIAPTAALLTSFLLGATLLAATPASATPDIASSTFDFTSADATVTDDEAVTDEAASESDAGTQTLGAATTAATGCRSFVHPGRGHVTVPAGYCYNPDAKKNKTLHDFCTKSPDGWYAANFKGPCARHDMCIEGKKVARSSCDSTFRSNMLSECNKVYGKLNPKRYECQGIALSYYAVVRAKTAIS